MADEKDPRRSRRRPRRRPGSRSGSSGDAGKSGSSGRGERSGANGRRSRQGGGRGRGQNRSRNARSGARARGRRAQPPANWWARRWIEVLEGFEVGRRLGRGRTYARQGQVTDLEIGKGFITAKVQGSRDAPYLVRMRFSMLSSTDWKKVVKALAGEPRHAAQLLAGEIPEDIEEVFSELELSLLPSASGDLKTDCSCPDKANPCKHIAAVYYLLGEAFDRDPFLIFRLRGIERAELIDAIRELGGASLAAAAETTRPEAEDAGATQSDDGGVEEVRDAPEKLPDGEVESGGGAKRRRADPEVAPEPIPRDAPSEPLPEEPHAFWAGVGATADDVREVRIPTIAAALPKRLGGLSFWQGELDCTPLIERVYREASVAGLDVFLGAPDAPEG